MPKRPIPTAPASRPLSLYPSHYAPPPAPPGSLSPMAMSEFTNEETVLDSRRRRQARNRSNARRGALFLLAGAVFGGALGLAHHLREQMSLPVAAASHIEALPPAPREPLPPAVAPALAAERAPSEPEEFGVAIPAVGAPAAPLVLVAPSTPAKLSSRPMRAKSASVATRSAAMVKAAHVEDTKTKEPKPAAKVTAKEPARLPTPRPSDDPLLRAAMGATENSL